MVFENDLGGNGRIQSLLRQLGLEGNNNLKVSDQEFSKIQIKIDALRDKSILFIENSLS